MSAQPSDRYSQIVGSGPGSFLASRLGLPRPEPLRRHTPGAPALPGPVLLGGSGRLVEPLTALLADLDATTDPGSTDAALGALVFDATGITEVEGLTSAARLLLPGHAPGRPQRPLPGPRHRTGGLRLRRRAGRAACARGLHPFAGQGGPARRHRPAGLPRPARTGAPAPSVGAESTLRFLLSARSAYVSGQVVRVGAGALTPASGPRAPAGRAGRGRHRRGPRHRRVHRGGALPRRGARGLRRRPAGRGGAVEDSPTPSAAPR